MSRAQQSNTRLHAEQLEARDVPAYTPFSVTAYRISATDAAVAITDGDPAPFDGVEDTAGYIAEIYYDGVLAETFDTPDPGLVFGPTPADAQVDVTVYAYDWDGFVSDGVTASFQTTPTGSVSIAVTTTGATSGRAALTSDISSNWTYYLTDEAGNFHPYTTTSATVVDFVGLTPGVTYSAYAEGFTAFGEVIQSNVADFTTNTANPPPLPPSPPPNPSRPVAIGGAPDGSIRLITPTGASSSVSPFGNSGAPTRTASADVNHDGTADVIAVTGAGTALRVAVLSGADGAVLVAPFDPFGGDFTGGGYVAAGDLDGDGRAEFVVTPDQGGGPRVTVFSLNPDGSTTVRANFFGIDDPAFRGGARAAVGDVNADGTPDVVVAAGFGGGPRTAIFSGQSVLAGNPARLVADFFAFPGADATNLRNGSFVAAGDITGDGFADLVFGGGPGGAPRVFILSGALVRAGDVAGAQANPVANFFVAGDLTDRGGARVAVTNSDGDGKADLAVGSGAGRPARVRVYLGKDFTGAGEPAATDLDPFGGAVLADGVYVG